MGKYREWNLWHGESQTLCKGERYPGENIPVIETKAVDDWRGMADKFAMKLKIHNEEHNCQGCDIALAEYEQFKKERS